MPPNLSGWSVGERTRVLPIFLFSICVAVNLFKPQFGASICFACWSIILSVTDRLLYKLGVQTWSHLFKE